MEEQFLTEILKDTYTLETLRKRYLGLKLMLQKQLFASPIDEKKERSVPAVEQKWLESFDQNIIKGIKSDQFRSINLFMDKFISETNSLNIYFVFLPDEDQIKEIGDWLRKKLNNPRLIFDVKVDPSLIGGCAIVYKGVYKDYSLKAKISGHKDKLIEEFRKYFKN